MNAQRRGGGSLLVRIGEERARLTFGRPAKVGRLTLEWRDGVLSARADEPFLVEPGGTTQTDARLAPATVIRDRGGEPAVLEVDADAFDP